MIRLTEFIAVNSIIKKQISKIIERYNKHHFAEHATVNAVVEEIYCSGLVKDEREV